MTDTEAMLRRQAEWQKARQSLTWPEKIRMAERVQESIRTLRAYEGGVSSTETMVGEAIRQLVDEYRGRCLWFLRPDYYPETNEEALKVLDSIQRHGDVAAFRRAGELKRWVSATTNAPSVTSSQKSASEAARATSPAGPR